MNIVKYYQYCPTCGWIELSRLYEKVDTTLLIFNCPHCGETLVYYTEHTANELNAIYEVQIEATLDNNPEYKDYMSNGGLKGVYIMRQEENMFRDFIKQKENLQFDENLYQKTWDLSNGKHQKYPDADEIFKRNHEIKRQERAINKSYEQQFQTQQTPEPPRPKLNQKVCPKCGGTEFTPVRKKFSLLTGFMTNKVEMICNNCGTKVK